GFGDNTIGALLTRGLVEIKRLGVALGARPETFLGLSGIGDLITTATSLHSRNRYVGFEIGAGRKLRDVVAAMSMVAEGVATTASVRELAQRKGVEMPITEQVWQVLYHDKDPRQAITELMTRELKAE
ncbi:MAG TPA: glycerol-3-phosphate dehydrogenase, partial [Candidatus Syntrophosphaera sp.]|nr:glycerol-3-phosphate dehydrogenase [Candidatus Syntrophosphaera sp.]